MKKKLNIDSITNELEGASLFFTRSVAPPSVSVPKKTEDTLPDFPISTEPEATKEKIEKVKKPKESKSVKSDNDDTVIPRHHDTMTPRYQDTTTPQIYGVTIELVRKAVKEFGKEAATHRFTVAEKKELSDLMYIYKNRGIKTSENEITRVAVNFIVEDYKVNGENSVLHKILKALKE